jgi:hypothetical protein
VALCVRCREIAPTCQIAIAIEVGLDTVGEPRRDRLLAVCSVASTHGRQLRRHVGRVLARR